MNRLENDDYKGAPVLYWIRLPLILVMILLPAYYAYTNINPGSGGEPVTTTLYYDSGEKMSEGEMKKEGENGEWTQWHKNGNIKSVGHYNNGLQDSLWQYFYETGSLKSTVNYKAGEMHGERILLSPAGKVAREQYFENGVEIDN